MERTDVFFEFDLDEHSVVVALLVNGKDFCGDGSHLGHFLRLTSPEMGNALKELQARTGIGGEEKAHYARACRRQSPTYSQTAEHDVLNIFSASTAFNVLMRD
jgi:hypothetical protein